jgi:FkbM family methyltransferase
VASTGIRLGRLDLRTYYSQNGEDIVLWALFAESHGPGFFVEVGALDGLRFSNTYSFEQEGWTGVCVEAHASYFNLLKRNRPNSVCVHAAVSDREEDEVDFYANSRGSLSTLDPTMEGYFRTRFNRYFTGFQIQRVQMRTLDSILEEARAPIPVDFVAIDVEGHEPAVLRGFTVSKYLPRVLLVEAMFADERKEIDALMRHLGYFKARELGVNVFYCRDGADAPKIATASVLAPLHHTPHPLDNNEPAAPR